MWWNNSLFIKKGNEYILNDEWYLQHEHWRTEAALGLPIWLISLVFPLCVFLLGMTCHYANPIVCVGRANLSLLRHFPESSIWYIIGTEQIYNLGEEAVGFHINHTITCPHPDTRLWRVGHLRRGSLTHALMAGGHHTLGVVVYRGCLASACIHVGTDGRVSG